MLSRRDVHADSPLDVYITVDTEVWPHCPQWRQTRLAGDIDHYIYGRTDGGEFGIRFQLDLMDAHGVKGVFFVEPLFSRIAGTAPLQEMVSLIISRGHDVQLHVHSEWLEWLEPELLPGRRGQHLRCFTLDEQELLLREGKQTLEEAGAPPLRAFRAGNFGANFDTLRALRRIGITVDSSYNPIAPKQACGIQFPAPLLQPAEIDGVLEFPVAVFEDLPGRLRPAQICAISFSEMKHALESAWRSGWSSFVIVTHSFELLNTRTDNGGHQRPCRFTVKRMESLCRFLQENNSRFRTATFSGPARAATNESGRPLRGSLLNTAFRFSEQLRKRL